MSEFLSPAQRLYEQALAEPEAGPARGQLLELLRRRGQHELARELEGLGPSLEPPSGTRDGQPLLTPPPPVSTSWGVKPLLRRLAILLLLSGLTLGPLAVYLLHGDRLEAAWRAHVARGRLSSPDPRLRLDAAAELVSSGALGHELPALLVALAPERLDGVQQRRALELAQGLRAFREQLLAYLLSSLEHAADARTWELAASELRQGWGLHYDLDGPRRRSPAPLPAEAYARLLDHSRGQPARRHLLLRVLCNRPSDTDPQPVLSWLVACCQSEDPERRRCGRELLPELLELRGPEALAVDALLAEAVPEALRAGGELEYSSALAAGLALGLPEALEHYLVQVVRPRTDTRRWKRRQRNPERATEDNAELAKQLDAYDGDALRAARAREHHPGVVLVLDEAVRRYEEREGAWRD